MNNLGKAGLIIMVTLNALVLLGQLWPAGAPPFAKYMNVTFLILSLIFFGVRLIRQFSK